MHHVSGSEKNCPQCADSDARARSYMLVTISTGTEPSNKLWYVEVAQLPKKPDGGLDMSSYDLRWGSGRI